MESRLVRLLGDEPDPLDRVIEIGLNRIRAQRKYYLANSDRIKRNLRDWRARKGGK